MDKDKLNSINKRDAVTAAFVALDAVQNLAPHVQVAAVAVLFTAFADTTRIGVSELVDKARRITKDDDTYYQREVKALRDYIQQELSEP